MNNLQVFMCEIPVNNRITYLQITYKLHELLNHKLESCMHKIYCLTHLTMTYTKPILINCLTNTRLTHNSYNAYALVIQGLPITCLTYT